MIKIFPTNLGFYYYYVYTSGWSDCTLSQFSTFQKKMKYQEKEINNQNQKSFA